MDDLTTRLADRLRLLRQERGMSLDSLAESSGVSRGTLSRIETGATSPTAEVLGRLAAAYGMSTSHILRMAEADAPALIPRAAQEVWRDPDTGFTRRSVSPPAEGLRGHVVEGRLEPGAVVRYDRVPVEGLEHHLLLRAGALTLSVGAADHALMPGDCLRYRLHGPSRFTAGPEGADYLIFII
ncbi:hypothetical protein ATO6_06740 [Oceanicola sp. 22II-s10i]|uniref:helix-turn-helix domain-containing protein n=1 Tax=Oceanicola sp. 22II-s10i TaxID=1317116 RepID=UPI000B52069E|nr:helix-turn-helix domain-containing protein [Oceanicola sp. 22II-s10i]OWU86496.1 hypothetical protein ATO6_06740 [Oceanicola sp. 22II-s10i]